MTLFIWTCTQDDQVINTKNNVSQTKGLNYKLKRINHEQLRMDSDIQSALSILERSFDINKQQDVNNRTTTQVADGLILFTDVINRIEAGETITWTFAVETPALENSDFENFMVKKFNDEFSYFLISYEMSYESEENPYEKVISYQISEEFLTLDNLNLARTEFTTPGNDTGGAGGGCEGEVYTVDEPCNQGGYHVDETYCCQHSGIHGCDNYPPCNYTCSGARRVLYIDFSNCNNTGDTPSGPTGDPAGGDNPNNSQIGGEGGGGPPSDGDNPVTSPVIEDPTCPPGSGKIRIDGICVCPEGKIEDENGVCICPEGYETNVRGECIKDGHCFELDKLMYATSSENPYIQNGSAADPTGENTHIRIAVTNMRDNLDSNFEHGFGLYNEGNFPLYGPYANYIPAQQQAHVYFPPRPFQFGTLHTHPVNDEAIPMFSHHDLYTLLNVRDLYVNSGGSLLNSNNSAGDDLFVTILVVKQLGVAKVYAIKINDITKLQTLEAKIQNKRKWRNYGRQLDGLFTDDANGIDGSPYDYQKVFLQFVKDQDLGLDLYEMEQENVGTPEVQEIWKKLSLSNDGNSVIEEPCNNI